MDKRLKTKWVKALRGGRYKQTTGALFDGEAYCCLGVLCRVAGAKYRDEAFHWDGDQDSGVLPRKLRLELKIKPTQEERLIAMNDCGGKGFKEIADYIDKRL